MKLKLLLIFLFSFVFTHSSFALSENNIIVFGDSLSDIGNNNWIEAIGAPITSFDEKGHKNTWAKYLSSKLFSKPMLPSNKENVNPLIDNVNYAYASADTSSDYLAADWPNSTTIPLVNPACKQPGLKKNNEGKVTSSCVPGVLEQINLYLKDVKSVPCSKSIFFIWAGANDLFYKLPSQPPQQIIATAVGNLLQAKNKLLENGISPKQIYILNLPDLSLTPFAIQHGLKLTALTMAFNNALAAALTNNLDPNHPGIANSHVISMFDLLNNVVKAPEKYDLTNVTDSCVEKGLTPLCNGYLFYDGKHPTAYVHKLIANEISKIIV